MPRNAKLISGKKDRIDQLEASKSSIKDLFNDLLHETKGFKYQRVPITNLNIKEPWIYFSLLQHDNKNSDKS